MVRTLHKYLRTLQVPVSELEEAVRAALRLPASYNCPEVMSLDNSPTFDTGAGVRAGGGHARRLQASRRRARP